MDVEDLLPDGRPDLLERITGIYQFRSGTTLSEVLKKIMAHDDTFVVLRKNGLEIFDTLKWVGVCSTTVSLGMLTKGSYLGMHHNVTYLVTFEPPESFLRDHSQYTPPVDLVELLMEHEPYKWGSSVESARQANEHYQATENYLLDYL